MISLKDTFARKSQKVTSGLDVKELWFNCNYDSTVYTLLKPKISTIAQLMPFACGVLDFTKISPQGLYLGGSSTGNIEDLINKRAKVGVGTDTGGSIIVPAARENFIGFKPTYGRISRYGLVPLCNFLDTVGLISNNITDIKEIFNILDVYDKKDPTSIPRKNEKLANLTVATNLFSEEDLTILKKNKTFSFEKLEIPSEEVLTGFYYYIMCPELYSNTLKYDGVFNRNYEDHYQKYTEIEPEKLRDQLPFEVKSRILLGAQLLSSNYSVTKIYKFKKYLNKLLGQKTWILPVSDDLRSNNLQEHTTHYSVIVNLTKRPCITIPTNLKKGIQIVGIRNSDLELLNLDFDSLKF